MPPVFIAAILGAAFTLTLTARVWGINSRFWLLGDQIRDWSIALGPFKDLPLVGPATHVNGYTVGPAFYWILWAIRVAVGPWFENLPHAGGVGQAILQSAADTLLLLGIWRRTGSLWIAVTSIVLLATASYDLSLSALVWNPVVGSTLAKMVTALMLLEWHRGSAGSPRGSLLRVGLIAALAWSAVHAYTGAIFVAVSVFIALLLDPFMRNDRKAIGQHALIITIAVALLQVPYLIHQFVNRFSDSAMGAVTDSVRRVFAGEGVELAKSIAGYAAAVNYIQILPEHVPAIVWALPIAGVVVAVRYRRDPLLLCMTLVPQLMAVAGYAFFLAALDNYYYLSLMPAAVLTIVLGLTAVPSPRVARAISIALCMGAFALVPARLRYARNLHAMPEYGALVEGSRTIARRGQPMRAIETAFKLPPTASAEFVYQVLGGQINRSASWVAVIAEDGSVAYRRIDA